ncbi:hypothetical protein AGLY_007066 [Aphis glycines]|uniref:Uncharacterized protein n=1 Tax=Aphis glycines TaxID=307491 RepID=A0A6G0TPM8_APHGL|nr:hypothetical protein AGLY_007066 [Aphis glycines]
MENLCEKFGFKDNSSSYGIDFLPSIHYEMYSILISYKLYELDALFFDHKQIFNMMSHPHVVFVFHMYYIGKTHLHGTRTLESKLSEFYLNCVNAFCPCRAFGCTEDNTPCGFDVFLYNAQMSTTVGTTFYNGHYCYTYKQYLLKIIVQISNKNVVLAFISPNVMFIPVRSLRRNNFHSRCRKLVGAKKHDNIVQGFLFASEFYLPILWSTNLFTSFYDTSVLNYKRYVIFIAIVLLNNVRRKISELISFKPNEELTISNIAKVDGSIYSA